MEIKTIPEKDASRIVCSDSHHWTYADLQELVGETMDRYEIIDGVLYVMPGAHVTRHQRTVGRISYDLTTWVREHELGEVFLSPADVVLREDRVVQPDVFFLTSERIDAVDAYVSVAPDLAVEVVSPWGQKYDRETKFNVYQEIGISEYWIVDPKPKTIEVYVLESGEYRMAGRYGSGSHAASVVLRGFEPSVDDLFR